MPVERFQRDAHHGIGQELVVEHGSTNVIDSPLKVYPA